MAGEPLGVQGQGELRGVSYWENGRRADVGLVATLVGPIRGRLVARSDRELRWRGVIIIGPVESVAG